MNTWEAHIESGNEHFRNEAYSLAEEAYIQACERAEYLFQHWFDAEEMVAAITISYFNLADCLKCQGQYKSAHYVLEKIHNIIGMNVSETDKHSSRYLPLLKARNKTRVELQRSLNIMNGTDEGTVSSFGVPC